MTQASAREMLGDTWIFKQIDGAIALREVALIEAVQNHKGVLMLPSFVTHEARRLPSAGRRILHGQGVGS